MGRGGEEEVGGEALTTMFIFLDLCQCMEHGATPDAHVTYQRLARVPLPLR